jgi:hypothetical protein
MSFGRPHASPDPITTISGTSTAVARGSATGFYVLVSAAARIAVRQSDTPLTLNSTNSAPLAASVLYGPFRFNGTDTHIHVAGVGGTPTATVTLV